MKRYAFMCYTDFDVELGLWSPDAKRIYSSLEELRAHELCVDRGCGWVKVEMRIVAQGEAQPPTKLLTS
jgi:hypothetical protein